MTELRYYLQFFIRRQDQENLFQVSEAEFGRFGAAFVVSEQAGFLSFDTVDRRSVFVNPGDVTHFRGLFEHGIYEDKAEPRFDLMIWIIDRPAPLVFDGLEANELAGVGARMAVLKDYEEGFLSFIDEDGELNAINLADISLLVLAEVDVDNDQEAELDMSIPSPLSSPVN